MRQPARSSSGESRSHAVTVVAVPNHRASAKKSSDAAPSLVPHARPTRVSSLPEFCGGGFLSLTGLFASQHVDAAPPEVRQPVDIGRREQGFIPAPVGDQLRAFG